mgnify:CR=1 FL=1
MYTVIKRMEISASHSLRLSYPSKCENLHGHNWMITVYCRSKELNADGNGSRFQPYQEIGEIPVDHQNLNDMLTFQPDGGEHSLLGIRADPVLFQGRGKRV